MADLVAQSHDLLIVCSQNPWNCGREISIYCTVTSTLPSYPICHLQMQFDLVLQGGNGIKDQLDVEYKLSPKSG